MMVKVLGNKFISYYINILYFLAIISLVIYFSILIIPSVKTIYLPLISILKVFNFAHSDHQTILIYNFGHSLFGIHSRNSGPFWEPGAFAGYLIVAYIFYFFSAEKRIDKKSLVLLITITTTISTTAYIALFVFLFFVYSRKIKNLALKISIIITLLVGSLYAYNTLDFLGEKIEAQIEYAQQKGVKKSRDSQRFLSILRDINYLRGNEFVGRGGNNATRYDLGPGGLFVISTVGLTDVIVRYGIPMFFIIIFFLYTSICAYLNSIQKKDQIFCLGIFMVILFTMLSEVYFTYPMYWGLVFLRFAYTNQKMAKSNKYIHLYKLNDSN